MSQSCIAVDSFERGFVVRPLGRIGGPEGETLNHELDRLVELKPSVIVLDMSRTDMLSSLAISGMIRLHKRLKETGGKARLAAVPANIMTLLQSVKLDNYIPVYLTLDEATR